MKTPETRPGLLLKVRDPEYAAAWDKFADIYRPVICRLARLRGMQAADADDLAQQVLPAIAGAIDRFDIDPERAKFRTWLHRVADNAILNALTRGVPDRGSGDDDVRRFLDQRPARSGPDTDLLRMEYRRELFLRAARQIRDEFTVETWHAFRLTTVEEMDIDEAARQLGRTRGSVYASRSRVMKRLRIEVERQEEMV